MKPELPSPADLAAVEEFEQDRDDCEDEREPANADWTECLE